jgi:hypothetical protein
MFQILALLTPSNLPPYEWVMQHIQVVGWPALCVIAWKAGNVFRKFVDKLETTTGQINTMATNHFPHMEASLGKQDGLLTDMSESLKEIASNTGRRRSSDYPNGNHF